MVKEVFLQFRPIYGLLKLYWHSNSVSSDMFVILVNTGNSKSIQSFIIDTGRGPKLHRSSDMKSQSTWSSVILSNSASLVLQACVSIKGLVAGVCLANKSLLIALILLWKKSTNLFAKIWVVLKQDLILVALIFWHDIGLVQ